MLVLSPYCNGCLDKNWAKDQSLTVTKWQTLPQVTKPHLHGLSPYQGMFQALTEIGQKHGLVGLWRGALGSLPRVAVGSSTQLCTFSSTKDLLSQWEVQPGKGVGHAWEGGRWANGGGP